MIGGPNLASRPFLDSRPIWVVTAVAVVVAAVVLVLLGIDYLQGNQELAERIARRDALRVEHDRMAEQLEEAVEAVEDVPWRALAARVERTNAILRERSFSWLEMLDDLEGVLPYDVRVTEISPDVEDSGVVIGLHLISRDRDALLELIDAMIADPRFDVPVPRDEVLPEESQSAGWEMNVAVTYLPDGERRS